MAKSTGAETPLMQQHNAIKKRFPDAILLFRVGDFYETFGEDAIVTSRVLGITLTKRNNGAAFSSELAGFPHHALDTYLHKLVKAGHRVAICDQLEDPKLAKGIVKRGVTEMVTPGIATGDKLLEHNSNNFLAAIHFTDAIAGIALLDISTGELLVSEGDTEYIDKLLQSLKPAEIIYQRSYQKFFKETFGSKFYTYTLDSWIFDETYASECLLKHFQTHSLKGFGVDVMKQAIVAAGAIFHYLKDTEHPNLQHITSIQRLEKEDHLWMDRFTIRNLELLSSGVENGCCLLKVLDNTVSPMGARLMKRWLVLPLKDIERINERLDLVEFFIKEVDLRSTLIQSLKQAGDIERLVSKIPLKKINPREVLQIARGLQQVELIRRECINSSNNYLKRLADALNPCNYILEKILNDVVDNPPVLVSKGGVMRQGVHAELDELRNIASTGKDFLVQLQQKESEATGISSLKVGFNNVFGYYLEVTNLHKTKVPSEWMRKQTLANAERYITPELKSYEEKIIGAEDKILTIEQTLYDHLLNELQDYLAPMLVYVNVFATLVFLICFAQNALQFSFKKPQLHIGLAFEI